MDGALPDQASWSDLGGALRIVARPAHLRQTLAIALVVGIVLFAINQLDVVLSGRAGPVVWLKVGLTFAVPFCVSNYGILVATRRRD